jgi:hypothetical protein
VGADRALNAYRLNRFFYLLHTDAEFLETFRRDANAAIARAALEPDEARAVGQAQVGDLYRAGAHPFLLHGLVRHRLCGVDQASYMAAVRDAAKAGSPRTRAR